MPFLNTLRELLENEENATAGKAFGGNTQPTKKSFSIPSIRDWILNQRPYTNQSEIELSLRRAFNLLPITVFKSVVGSLLRFSFIIELTNLKVGSTKMKTRWLPGLIQMPQEGSFEPIQGSFEPGNDPRSSTFEECVDIFSVVCEELCDEVQNNGTLVDTFRTLSACNRVAYEFPFTYLDSGAEPVHTSENVGFNIPNQLSWLLKARTILNNAPAQYLPALKKIIKTKIQVKVYLTDRSLTGKDKTNRAKRWEVLAGDFQHASLPQCWSVEEKLTKALVSFASFPDVVKQRFVDQELITGNEPTTRCPVTLEELDFNSLSNSVLNNIHGVSDYQIGHLTPLKRDGHHVGNNVCWQSADGNRIQGNLTMEETEHLLDVIGERRTQLI